jgi:large subunit ribosomal protein L4
VAADETKKTEGETLAKAEAAAKPAAKKPVAKKPAANKPAAKKPAAKAAKDAAATAAKKPAAKKPAAKAKPAAKTEAAKPAAKAKPTGKTEAAKPAAKKPAAKKPAAKAKPAAAAKKPVAKAEPAARKPAAERPAKQKAVRKPAPELRHGTEGKATVVDAAGKELESRALNAALFAVPADVNTLHLVVRAEQAARRRGTASTKTRGEVSGSTAKLYRQKGTGRARAGSVKSPIRSGGGVTFGPHPRSFAIKVNRKVVRQALAMALSNRAENGNVFVAAGLQIDEPSTATLNEFLVKLDIAAPVLVVTQDEPGVAKSVRNLSYAEVSEVGALSTEQVLRARSLVLTEKAFAALNEA